MLILLTASCGSFEPGKPLAMDGDDVSYELEKVAFTIPDGFEFIQGVKYAEFVGQPAWAARFDGPNELGDGRAVAAANPSYPPLQPADCGTASKDSWTSLGSKCEPEMLFTSRLAGGSSDAFSVMLTTGAQESSLFIYCEGH